MGRLDGKVALITGAARGQGEAEARLFVSEGASVVLGDVLDEPGAALAEELGDAASFVHHDVTSPDDWSRAVTETKQRFGSLDILVNNAGVFSFTPIATTSVDEYLAVVRVNQLGTFLGIQAASKAMGDGGGTIINISSVAGLRGGPATIAYTATKFAIRGMTKVAAFELARAGVRVISIHAGFIDTPMLDAVLGVTDEATRGEIADRIPIGSVSEPIDVATSHCSWPLMRAATAPAPKFVVDGGLTAGLSLAR